MKDTMTPRERMLAAMRREIPDRVPVSPDISNMVPAKLTGRPFWDVYLYKQPFLGHAYIEAIKYFGIDGWYIYDELKGGNACLFSPHEPMESLVMCGSMIPKRMFRTEVVERTPSRIVVRTEVDTPLGPLSKVDIYPAAEPPWPQEKWIKDIDRDWPRLHWLMGEDWEFDLTLPNRDKLGELGVYSLMLFLPLDWWFHIRQGGVEQVSYDLTDEPEKMAEIFNFYTRFCLAELEAYIQAGADEVHLQGSASSLSMTSLNFYIKYNLPFIQKVTTICKKAGLISHQHTCGRSAKILEVNYVHADVDVMEPLEGPPGGDVDMAEAKRRYGDKFCLKGNLNTFELMLRGIPQDVEREAKKLIDVAAAGGGFILSTGDQCGRDTPYENIFKLVEVSRTYGRYR